ncbi:DUF1365 domain-containing protein [Marinicella litoralis]|uniref:DUF1365 family protein n=1 Tax=Marinicella litoralis TaxID=644220 RepID=A0A4R6XVV2_9GAMM|nr:DUF1365 domain-containing protein [Marinicella litoralis]TDR22689.1 hypothetical protein C8D91_1182 [Marinicella litoralis]
MNESAKKSTNIAQLQAGYAEGFVIHNRLKPNAHRFKYDMCWCVFDLNHLDQWMASAKYWRHNAWSIFSLKDTDYINSEQSPIIDKVKKYLETQTQEKFNGQVYLFTHPRFLGYGFNSVSFYFCYQNNQLVHIVSEINNTPWGEKKLYLHACQSVQQSSLGHHCFEFKKQFHISPFVGMDIDYSWDFYVDDKSLKVKMKLMQDGVNILNVILDTKITPRMDNKTHKFPFKLLFQPWKMAAGIYWQAFKLWIKKVPFYSHPQNK